MSDYKNYKLVQELIAIFGDENIEVVETRNEEKNCSNCYPLKERDNVIAWIKINENLALDPLHDNLIRLLLEKQDCNQPTAQLDREEDMWRVALTEELSSWREKWDDLRMPVEETYTNVYMHLPQVNTEKEDISGAIKELLLVATEQKSYFIPIKKGFYVWIVPYNANTKQEVTAITEGVIQTITSELLLDLQVYIGESYQMPMALHNLVKEEEEYVSIMQKSPLNKHVVTYTDLIPFLFIHAINKAQLTKTVEQLIGTITQDDEMLHTLHVFMKENLNVSEAAKKLYIHRNSMQYRLEKFIDKTGIDIRKFEDAVNVYLVILALGIVNKK